MGCIGFGVWLSQEVESKEFLVFNLNPLYKDLDFSAGNPKISTLSLFSESNSWRYYHYTIGEGRSHSHTGRRSVQAEFGHHVNKLGQKLGNTYRIHLCCSLALRNLIAQTTGRKGVPL